MDAFPRQLDPHQQELAAWLALLRAPGIGAIRYNALLRYFHHPHEILRLNAGEFRAAGLPDKLQASLARIEWPKVMKDLEWLDHSPQHHIITLNSPDYPELLREIADPPPLLFIQGDPTLLNSTQLAIVGSRTPSRGGRDHAYGFARALVEGGITVTSGLALGIDGAAHQGALEGGGPTIAVTGTGLDRIYPARHRTLASEIAGNGALVSEFPTGLEPLKQNFPRRNRIISGLSLGTLVVEAALQSGSLITARQAAEQGREVFAIPGSIHNPLSRGCHWLIREGAKLVESVADILEELPPAHPSRRPTPPPTNESIAGLDPNMLTLLENLDYEPASADTLVERTQLTAEQVSSILLLLELQGLVTIEPGGFYSRTQK